MAEKPKVDMLDIGVTTLSAIAGGAVGYEIMRSVAQPIPHDSGAFSSDHQKLGQLSDSKPYQELYAPETLSIIPPEVMLMPLGAAAGGVLGHKNQMAGIAVTIGTCAFFALRSGGDDPNDLVSNDIQPLV